MADLKPLVSTASLKTDLITLHARSNTTRVQFDYDPIVDALTVLFPNNSDEDIVAHYVDDYVALLYLGDSLEIVGLQIENFALAFVPQHSSVARMWQLHDDALEQQNLGGMIALVEQRLPELAKAATRELQDVLGERGSELLAAMT
jgi:hypothetical protein